MVNGQFLMSNGNIDILVQRAEVLLSRNINQAFALLDDALAMARRDSYKKGLAKVHFAYGLCYQKENSYKKSLTSFTDALQLFEESQSDRDSIKCLKEISTIYY